MKIDVQLEGNPKAKIALCVFVCLSVFVFKYKKKKNKMSRLNEVIVRNDLDKTKQRWKTRQKTKKRKKKKTMLNARNVRKWMNGMSNEKECERMQCKVIVF